MTYHCGLHFSISDDYFFMCMVSLEKFLFRDFMFICYQKNDKPGTSYPENGYFLIWEIICIKVNTDSVGTELSSRRTFAF